MQKWEPRLCLSAQCQSLLEMCLQIGHDLLQVVRSSWHCGLWPAGFRRKKCNSGLTVADGGATLHAGSVQALLATVRDGAAASTVMTIAGRPAVSAPVCSAGCHTSACTPLPAAGTWPAQPQQVTWSAHQAQQPAVTENTACCGRPLHASTKP